MKKLVLALAGVLVVLAVAGRLFHQRPAAPGVTAFPVERRDLAVIVKASGKVEPKNQIAVRAPVVGRIDELSAQIGSVVKKGGVLALMSSSDRAAILDKTLSEGATVYKKWKEFYRPTPVVAPVSGKIINRLVVEGESVYAGQALFVLADSLILRAQVDETDISRIRNGQEAAVITDSYPDRPFKAKVTAVGLQAGSSGGVTMYQVELQPLQMPAELKTGMSAEVVFPVQERKQALTIPLAAAGGREGAQVSLLVRRPNEPPSPATVKLGISDGKHVEVVSGLSDGDQVLVPTPGFMRQK